MPQALVIGINRYVARQIPQLKCAVNDAEAMSQRLKSAGFDVVKLIDDEATRKDISWELGVGINDRIANEYDPVLVSISGHGMCDLRDNADGDKGWSTYLLPYDADIDQPLASAFPIKQLWELLNRLTTRRLLVLLDTCFSGALAEDGRGFTVGGRGGLVRLPDDLFQLEGEGRAVISACGPDEVARENVRQGHGNFTKAVLTVLDRGVEVGERQAPVMTLGADIRKEVLRETRGKQTPSFYAVGGGADWSIPLPPPARYQAPLPAWALVGTSGGVGKTTLAEITAELLAEAGNTVLYLDADIAHHGGTSQWCARVKTDLARTRTFADHIAEFSRKKTSCPADQLQDRLLDVTPEYLRRRGCGKIYLLPAARASDKLFAFELVAEIKDRRSNATCRQILDTAFKRGVRHGATCIVIDCGAQFDPLAVNALAAAHHPLIVAAARGGSRDQRDTILSNCMQTIEDFDRMRVETVVNRVPSRTALLRHWGEAGYGRGNYYHFLPFDPALFKDWEDGRPNFELGYDELSQEWHNILVASDRNACDGLHRELLPSEWDRFSRWAIWLTENPDWARRRRAELTRKLRRSYLFAVGHAAIFGVGIGNILLHLLSASPEHDMSILPMWAAIALGALFGVALIGNALGGILLRRRGKVLGEVIKHSTSREQIKNWFSVPRDEGPWWQVWKTSRRAAIEWLYKQVVTARAKQLPSGQPDGAAV